MDNATHFNRLYLYLVVACGAALAAAILLAVYLTVSSGLLLSVATALLYRFAVARLCKTELSAVLRRVSDGLALSPLPRQNADALTVPARLMWLDVTELSPAAEATDGERLRCLYLPRSIRRVGSGALACLAENGTLYYEGTEEEWNAVEKADDTSGLSVRFACEPPEKEAPSEEGAPPSDPFETFDR